MILSGLQIKERLGKDIIIDPFDEQRLNPNSYNLRLSDEMLTYEEVETIHGAGGLRSEDFVLDMKKNNPHRRWKIPEEGFLMKPGRLYLGRTMEMTETKNLVPLLEGRSSVGRLGIFIHATAGFGDVGFKGYWTLELSCVEPVRIYAGVEICQIFYHTVGSPHVSYDSGKYQGNTGVQPSKLWKDFLPPS